MSQQGGYWPLLRGLLLSVMLQLFIAFQIQSLYELYKLTQSKWNQQKIYFSLTIKRNF